MVQEMDYTGFYIGTTVIHKILVKMFFKNSSVIILICIDQTETKFIFLIVVNMKRLVSKFYRGYNIRLYKNHSKGLNHYLSLMPETYEHEVTFETTSKYFIDAKSAGMYAKYIQLNIPVYLNQCSTWSGKS